MLIYDIETKTFGKPDPEKDKYRVFGYHVVNTNESGVIFDDIPAVKRLLKKHKIIIGFNNLAYDNVVLEKENIDFRDNIVIDLYKVVKAKSNIMNLNLKSYSLSNIAKHINLTKKQEKFDYSMLNDDVLSDSNKKLIEKYTLQDIKVTFDLWNYVKTFFEPFKEFIDKRSAMNYKHVTLSTGAYAYKVICQKAGLIEKYGNLKHGEKYKGGYVATPSIELIKGKIYCLDFNSAYPHSYIQGNLFSNNCKCCNDHEKYVGGKLFKLKGKYCAKRQGKIEEVVKKFYMLRQEYKKNKDPREYTIKIIINTMYGICGNPGFVNLYNLNTASDCTHMVRTMVKLAREKFKKAGYNVIYSDTDSVYIEDTHDNENLMLPIKDSIVNEIKCSMPFPQETFDMGIDDRIKLMYFPGLKKKNYIYVTNRNKIKIKGLPFKKSNASPLSMVVFEKHIKNKIINDGVVKFDPDEIKQWVFDELEKDLTLAAIEFKVMDVSVYKNATQLQCQISKSYGAGNHKLIPNTIGVGVGKGKGYCKIEEFKEKEMKLITIDLKKTYSELSVFSDGALITIVKNKRTKKANNTLYQWLENG